MGVTLQMSTSVKLLAQIIKGMLRNGSIPFSAYHAEKYYYLYLPESGSFPEPITWASENDFGGLLLDSVRP